MGFGDIQGINVSKASMSYKSNDISVDTVQTSELNTNQVVQTNAPTYNANALNTSQVEELDLSFETNTMNDDPLNYVPEPKPEPVAEPVEEYQEPTPEPEPEPEEKEEKSFWATVGNYGIGFLEGIVNWGEKVNDVIKLGGAELVGFVGDTVTGKNLRESVVEDTKADIAEDDSKFIFDEVYDHVDWDEKSYASDQVRSAGNISGEVATNIAVAWAGGSIASGAGGAAEGTVAAANTFKTGRNVAIIGNSMVTGLGEGEEEVFRDGGTVEQAIGTGLFRGSVKTGQYLIGAEINGYMPFDSAVGNAAVHITLDTADGAAGAFVDPIGGLIYKDGVYDDNGNYVAFTDDDTIFDKYGAVFEESGGWKNVGTQAAVGGAMSTASEVTGIAGSFRKKTNVDIDVSNNKTGLDVDVDNAAKDADINIDNAAKDMDVDLDDAVKDVDADFENTAKNADDSTVAINTADRINDAKIAGELVSKEGIELTDDFTYADLKNYMDGLTAHDKMVLADETGWITHPEYGYGLITEENIDKYLTVDVVGNRAVLNLTWPEGGGYDVTTIKSVADLPDTIEISRIGGTGGTAFGIGKIDADGEVTLGKAVYDSNGNFQKFEYPDNSSYATASQRSIPKESGSQTIGRVEIFDVKSYKTAVDIVTGEGTNATKISSLVKALNIDDTVAEDLIKSYNYQLSNPEVSGKDSISNVLSFSGKNVDGKYGYYGTADTVFGLEGGSGQMNTVFNEQSMIDSGIITVTDEKCQFN